MYKMIVTDLDGTLLDNNKIISKKTIEYLKKLKNNGYIICIDSGRTYGLSKYVTDNASFANYLITDNGACVYDLNNNKILFTSIISNELVKELFVKYIDYYFNFEINTSNYVYRYTIDKSIKERYLFKIYYDKEEFISRIDDVYNVTFSLKDNNINIIREISNIDNIRLFVTQDSFSDKKWVKISNRGINKYNALISLANYLKINNQDIIAFGDGLNDIEMIKNVGLGVAIKNALPEIKEVAKDITLLDNNHDGGS